MPLALEPNKTYPIVLDSDLEVTPRPTFLARTQSMRGQAAIFETLEIVRKEGVTTDDVFNSVVDKLFEVFAGWQNVPLEFSKDSLRDALSYSEARELLTKAAYNSETTYEEKKSSE